jgi:hypothetical protein
LTEKALASRLGIPVEKIGTFNEQDLVEDSEEDPMRIG